MVNLHFLVLRVQDCSRVLYEIYEQLETIPEKNSEKPEIVLCGSSVWATATSKKAFRRFLLFPFGR
jgi:hypothetical protein